MATLRLIQGNEAWTEYTVESPSMFIGRSKKECAVVLSDETVSRKHAEITRDRGEYYLIDLRSSRAGTQLNGQRLVKNIGYRLKQNDEIKICNYVLQFVDVENTESSESSVRMIERDTATFSKIALDGSSGSWKDRVRVNAEEKLKAIMDVTRHLRRCETLQELLTSVLDSLLELFAQAYRGIVVLTEATIELSVRNVVKYRDGLEEDEALISARVISSVIKQQVSLLSDDKRTMCAPLIDSDHQSLGVIRLDAHEGSGNFTEGDLDLLNTVAVEASFAVENWILHEMALRDHELRIELKFANEVQIGLLPSEPPHITGYEVFDYYSAARQVGGDYYDYLVLDDNRIAFVLGDVSGKGIPAALLMAQMSGALSVYLSSGLGIAEVVRRANRGFQERPTGRFITLIVAVLDTTTHQIQLVNAGHMPPLLRRGDGKVVEIGGQQSGLPLGVIDDEHYNEIQCSLAEGESLLMFTDGVTDATNEADELFGHKRLRSALAANLPGASNIGSMIVDEVFEYSADQPQSDDICLVCLSRDPT